ncbi:MAG: ABC transporter ATP-binding protein [Firmicutes bacterium]|nr:ABC transporter ATP-binding protein [Bacillota bacterium]
MALLAVEHLRVTYGAVEAVRDVSFELERGEILGIVGESGSGKSTLGYAIAKLLRPPGQIAAGRVWFDGVDLVPLRERDLKAIRWRELAVVMQSGMNALNPVTPIRRQFEDAILTHRPMGAQAMRERVREMLALVNIEERYADHYPHELSGGMKQRVAIALALVLDPKLIIFDEPTTALDVVVQRYIVQNLKALRARYHFAALFISHDLGTVLEIADRVAVMYGGRLVEIQDARALLKRPRHPYTQALLRCFPDPRDERIEVVGIPGTPPDLADLRPGCAFAPRCSRAQDRCWQETPAYRAEADGSGVACHAVQDEEAVHVGH